MLTTLNHFVEDFFTSDEVSEYPISCFAALEKKNIWWWEAMSNDLFGHDAEIEDVIKKIKETNKCTSMHLPTSVWIDVNGNWTIDIFPKSEDW